MKNLIYLPLLFLLLECKNNTSLNPNLYVPESEYLKEMITYDHFSMDSIRIHSSEKTIVEDKYFSHIIVSNRNKYFEFTPLDTIIPTYKKLDKTYLMVFISTIDVPITDIFYDLEIKFYINERDYRSISISIELYKYPFKSSELLFDLDREYCGKDFSKLPSIQSFDIFQDDLFFHPSGFSGIYKYALNDHRCEPIVGDYSSGDWFCVYENKLYIDFSHRRIGVTDIGVGDNIPFLLDLGSWDWDIRGMDIYNDTLYVLSINYALSTEEGGGPNFLSKFELDGTHISTESFNYDGWSMTIYDEYLYTISYLGNKIIRYHIPTKKFEIVIPDPEIFIGTIQVINGLFYYSDVNKRIICYLPLSDIFEN